MQKVERFDSTCPHCGHNNPAVRAAQPRHVLPCGTVLRGRYVIGRMLGQGGFGITYIGYDAALELRVCIKEYFPDGAAMRYSSQGYFVTWSESQNARSLKDGRESFVKEARKAVKLRKLNSVVQVWDVFFENETSYIVMDYIDGITLKESLSRRGKALSEEECLQLLSPVMEDLEEVHARGIIHRDISPDNLMLQPDGTLVLLDIGAAKDLNSGNSLSTTVVAKHGFSPMEQYVNTGNSGTWTDVYAMCATIIYCMTGEVIPTAIDRATGTPLDLSAFSPAFAAALERGLAIRAEDRTQTIKELKDALTTAVKAPKDFLAAKKDDEPERENEPKRENEPERENEPKREPVHEEKDRRKLIRPLLAVLLVIGIGTGAAFGYRALHKTGWQERKGEWYYYSDGQTLTGWQEIDGAKYYFDDVGTLQTGWQEIDGAKYYFNDIGTLQTGWQEIDGAKYFFNDAGILQTGWTEILGCQYYFNGSGILQTGWHDVGGATYHFSDSGMMQTGWQELSGAKYYFNDSGIAQHGWREIDGAEYYFGLDGVMQTGWQDIGEARYYFGDDGIMRTGWQEIDEVKYYFGDDGVMRTGKQTIEGKIYRFDDSGAMVVYTNRYYSEPQTTKPKQTPAPTLMPTEEPPGSIPGTSGPDDGHETPSGPVEPPIDEYVYPPDEPVTQENYTPTDDYTSTENWSDVVDEPWYDDADDT